MQLSEPEFSCDKKITIDEPIKALFDTLVTKRQKRSEITAARHRLETAGSSHTICEERLSVLRDWLVALGFREITHLAEAIFVLETRYQNSEGTLPQPLLKMLTNKGKGAAARLWMLQNKEYNN